MRGWFEKRFDYRQALSASTPDDQNELVDRYLHRGCSPSCATLRSCSMRASIRLAERGLNPCSSGPFEFRSESGVDPSALARTAGGDLKGRARGADPPPWRLQGFARGGSFGDFLQVAAPHVVDIPVDRNRLGDQRVVANPLHVSDDPSRVILHRESIDKLTFRRSRPPSDIAKSIGSEFRRLEAAGKKVPHHLVGEEQTCRSRCGE